RIGLGVNPGLNRNTSGAVYPYTIPGVLSITGNSFDPDYWYFLYNWQIGGGCVSPRTAVVATVDPPTAGGTASADQAICVGVTPADIVLSGHTGTVVKWQRSSDASFTSPVDIAVTSATLTGAQIGPLAATTYFRAVVQSGTCAPENSSVVTITVANPTATIAYTNSPYCFSAGTAAVSFTGTTGGSYAASPTGLSINASTGAITLGTSTAGTYTVTYSLAASGGCPAFSTSTSVTISSAGTWLGVTSADWNTASNWCGGIPTSTTDVTIPSVAPNMPNLSAGTGTVRNLSISNGGSVTVGTGGLLDLYGNISGTGTFTATNGSISFRGSANQATPGISAANITMNGSGGWTPGANSTVSGQLSLTSGHITLGNTNLSLQNSSTGSIASHIIVNGTGRVVVSNLAAANIRVVPVGSDASSYNPVTLLANAGHITDNFTVGVQQGVFVNGSSGSTFTTHVVDRMWSINESTAGGSNVNITLQWTAGQELTNFNRAKSYLMQHNGSSWITAPETAASGNDPYTQTKQSVTSLGSFAVQTQPIPRPLTGIYPNPTRSQLNVVIDLPAAQKVTLTVFDAAGKLVKQYATNLNTGLNLYPMQVYDLSAGVYFIKVSISSNPEFMLTKFVKE
ncbi:MAG TPA: T9SS type A sorting domain-containing protein, partial [Chitinophagaceae bacterium]|nr:T9SS type A sorting domain-containing protein [Chitinophagaceae bacterium]